uniref:DUF5641 domain-containing protein n=1 Tax=Meloidogyne incognita TaxID=6306 RepID=A0A914LTZ2_MELIC
MVACLVVQRGRNASEHISDNYVLANKALLRLCPPTPDQEAEKIDMNTRGIQWLLIPQLFPWMGGFYERLVAIVKSCFMRTVGRRVLTYDQLSTFTAEVEAVLNHRPLAYVSEAQDAPRPLRPIDLVQPGAIVDLPIEDCDYNEHDRKAPPEDKLIALWKGTQVALEAFWDQWVTEYLTMLRERSAWKHKGPRLKQYRPPSVGEVVLIGDDLHPRNIWQIARVTELNGSPPNVRSVKLQLPNGHITTRPVSKLYPLECSRPTEESTTEPNNHQGLGKEPEKITKQSGDRAMELEQPEEPESTQPVPEQDSSKEPTKKVWNLRPRRKTSISLPVIVSWALIVAFFISMLLPVTALVDCSKCLLACTTKGIMISSPQEITKLEICCEGDCLIRQATSNVTYELPQEMLLRDYTCKSYFWTTASETCTVHTTCPAVGDCSLIDCLFCIDHVANPNCSPRWAAFLTGILMCFILCMCGCTLCLLRICSFNVRALMSICYCIVGCGTLCTRKTTQQAQTLARTTGIAARARIMRQQLNQASRNLQLTGQEWRRAHLDRILGRRPQPSNWIPLVVLLALANYTDSSNTIAVTTKSESCQRGPTGISCVLNYATTLTLLPKGQTTTLLLRNEHGIALGTLSIIVDALTMNCVPKSEGWFRSYTMETLAVKRCPTSGSCKNSYCSEVRPSTIIPELREVNNLPGISRCEPSSSFWFYGCGLPTDACLFYRYFARPTTGNTFELISCPTWEFNIHADIQLEVSGKKPLMESIILHPGMTFHWNNVSLTPIAAAVPPAPVLNRQFITDGNSVAMVENIPRDLLCSTESDARLFNCSISNSVCIDCIHDHSSGNVACSCRDLNLERILIDSSVRLPLNVAKLLIRNERGNIFADYGYSPLQLHVQMRHLELLLEFQEARCTVQTHNLTGCYKCESGAQLQYTCLTDQGDALANIECADGTVFSARCSPNGTFGRENLPFDHFQIKTKCRVDCPAGETQFELTGALYYVPIKKRFQHGYRDSETLDLPSGNWWDTGFDPLALASILTSLSSFTSLILALILGIGLLYLFIRLNPVFRAWKAMARIVALITLISLCFATQAPGGPYRHKEHTISASLTFTVDLICFEQQKSRVSTSDPESRVYGLESRVPTFCPESRVGNLESRVSTFSTYCLEPRLFMKDAPTHSKTLAPPIFNTTLAPPTFNKNNNFTTWQRTLRPIYMLRRWHIFIHSKTFIKLILINMLHRLPAELKPRQLDHWLDFHHPGWNLDEKIRFNAGVSIAKIIEGKEASLEMLTAKSTQRRPVGLSGFSRLPANEELIMPNVTVEQYYSSQGVTLDQPNMKCIMFGNPLEKETTRHGYRGSSKKSLRRNRGKSCWRQGYRHYEFVPPERLHWILTEQTENDLKDFAYLDIICDNSGESNISQPPDSKPPHNNLGCSQPSDQSTPSPTQDIHGSSEQLRQYPTIPISPVIIMKESGFSNGGFNQGQNHSYSNVLHRENTPPYRKVNRRSNTSIHSLGVPPHSKSAFYRKGNIGHQSTNFSQVKNEQQSTNFWTAKNKQQSTKFCPVNNKQQTTTSNRLSKSTNCPSANSKQSTKFSQNVFSPAANRPGQPTIRRQPNSTGTYNRECLANSFLNNYAHPHSVLCPHLFSSSLTAFGPLQRGLYKDKQLYKTKENFGRQCCCSTFTKKGPPTYNEKMAYPRANIYPAQLTFFITILYLWAGLAMSHTVQIELLALKPFKVLAPPIFNYSCPTSQIIYKTNHYFMAQAQNIPYLSEKERIQLKAKFMTPIPSVCLVCDFKKKDPIGHKPGDIICPYYNDGFRRKTWIKQLGFTDKQAVRRAKAALIKKLTVSGQFGAGTSKTTTTVTTIPSAGTVSSNTSSAKTSTLSSPERTTTPIIPHKTLPAPDPRQWGIDVPTKLINDLPRPGFGQVFVANKKAEDLKNNARKVAKQQLNIKAPGKKVPSSFQQMVSKYVQSAEQKETTEKKKAAFERELGERPFDKTYSYDAMLDPDSLDYIGDQLTKEKLKEMEFERPLRMADWRNMMSRRVNNMVQQLRLLDGQKQRNPTQTSHLAHPHTWKLVKEIYEAKKSEKPKPHRTWNPEEVKAFIHQSNRLLEDTTQIKQQRSNNIEPPQPQSTEWNNDILKVINNRRRRNSLSPTSNALLSGYSAAFKSARQLEEVLLTRPSFKSVIAEQNIEEKNVGKKK